MILAQAKNFKAARSTIRGKYYVDACVTLNAGTAPVAFASRRVAHVSFLISLVLEQTSEDCIGNTEHSNINVNDECNIIFCTFTDPIGVQ